MYSRQLRKVILAMQSFFIQSNFKIQGTYLTLSTNYFAIQSRGQKFKRTSSSTTITLALNLFFSHRVRSGQLSMQISNLNAVV